MPLYTSTGAFNVAVNDTTGRGRYSSSGALRINLVTGSSYVGLYAADGALNVVDVSGVAISTYGGLYHPSGAIRGRTAPTTLSGLQAPDGSYYFLGLFSPLNLFANGEQGAWYDPSDFLPNWRLNLLTRSEEFDNAAWTKSNASISSNSTVAPDGTTTADTINSSAGYGSAYQAITGVVGVAYKASINVKKTTGSLSYYPLFQAYVGGGGTDYVAVLINTTAGTLSNVSGTGYGVPSNPTCVSNGDYWIVSMSFTATGTSLRSEFYPAASTNGTTLASVASGSQIIWGADLRLASNASVSPTYQKITDGVADYFTYQPQPVMFQDSAGTTPVTAVEQPVGLLLDKSKGLAVSSTDALGGNGNFSNASYWSDVNGVSTISSGQLSFNGSATLGGVWTNVANPLTIGRFYQVTFDVVSISQGGVRVWLGSGQPIYTATTAGSHTYRGACTGDRDVRIYNIGSATTAVVDNVVIREIPGNHASQSTAASRPVLSARVNLLTQTEAFDNAVWGKDVAGSATANTVVAPNGTTTADTLTDNATASQHRAYQTITVPSGALVTFSVYLKNGTRRYARVGLNNTDDAFVIADLQTGTLAAGTNTTGWVISGSSITPVGNDWFFVSLTASKASTTTYYPVVATCNVSTTSLNGYTYTGNGSTIHVWGADLRVTNVGVNLPAYQRVGAAVSATTNPAVTGVPDYDTSGFPLYLKFDGVDDSLATGTIDPGAVDKAQVFAGVRKLSDTVGMVAELSATVATNVGSFYLTAGTDSGAAAPAGGNGYVAAARGSATQVAGQQAQILVAAPDTSVLAITHDISGDLSTIRRNTVAGSSANGDKGAGNFGSYPLYIGRRNGSTVPYNGQVYSLILRFSEANLSDAQIASTETYVNSKTGAY